jgi:hypothetical protein
MRFDATQCECRIFTRRSGLLGAVGHDLELAVGDYWIAVEHDAGAGTSGEYRVSAEFTASTVHVIDAVDGGLRRTGALTVHDKTDIDRNLADHVLSSARFPVIAFRSTRVRPESSGYRVEGRLSLHGLERNVACSARREGDRLTAQLVLHQPDFGIQPFKALAGALRVHPDVIVRASVPFTAATTG